MGRFNFMVARLRAALMPGARWFGLSDIRLISAYLPCFRIGIWVGAI